MASAQFYEKIVKATGKKQIAKRISGILIYVLYLFICFTVGIFNPERSILIFAGGVLSCILLITISWKYLFLEYEYSFCQGTLTISKIYGKRKIKALIDVDLRHLTLIAPATDENIARAENLKPEGRIIAVSSEYADDIWLIVTGEENEPRTLIFIEADERALEILKFNSPFAFVKKN